MAGKRTATSDLNHDNWNQDDEKEEAGVFQQATPDEMKRRTIKTAVRRNRTVAGSECLDKPSPFSRLGNMTSFNLNTEDKIKSFSFLGKPDTAAVSKEGMRNENPFKPAVNNSHASGMTTMKDVTLSFGFHSSGMPQISTDPSNPIPAFGIPQLTRFKTSSSTNGTDVVVSIDPANKTGPAGDAPTSSPFYFARSKIATDKPFTFNRITEPANKNTELKFPSLNASTGLFDAQTSNGSIFQDKTGRSAHFLSSMKDVNQSFIEWVQKRLAEEPTGILTRCFKDYVNHVQDLFDEEKRLNLTESERLLLAKQEAVLNEVFFKTESPCNDSRENRQLTPPPAQAIATKSPSIASGFTGFGSNFSSGTSEKPQGFSFGGDKPFTFPNVVSTPSVQEEKNDEADGEEPPKNEFTQVVEEGTIYSKRCKVFVRKDDSKDYQDRGVGTLFLKPVVGTNKTQLIVRADTSLGNLLLNVLLNSEIPIQKMTTKSSNTVMLVCIPTTESKPPPRPVLIRVKTNSDADELISKLEEQIELSKVQS